VAQLLATAEELGLHVAGVSFHVGSGSSSGDAFKDAVARAAAVFELAAKNGHPMSILDVGGGFPGVDSPEVSFRTMADALRSALQKHFPKERGVRVIAEPGRFFASPTHTLAASVIGKKIVQLRADEGAATGNATGNAEGDSRYDAAAEGSLAVTAERINYYINDGLYGSFNCVLYDHATPEVNVLPTPGETTAAVDEPPTAADDAPLACVWGPTCDGIDCVISDAKLPPLQVGSWLYFPDMGAYTACAGSNFNGMDLPNIVYLQARGNDRTPKPPDEAAAAMLAQLAEEGVTPAPELK